MAVLDTTLSTSPFLADLTPRVRVYEQGALYLHRPSSSEERGCVLVLPSDLDALLEAVKIAIAFRDAE